MVHSALVPNLSLRERVGALRHLPALFRLVWQASPSLTASSLALRLGRAAIPILMLYVGKLIIDEVVAQTRMASASPSLGDWLASGRLSLLGGLVCQTSLMNGGRFLRAPSRSRIERAAIGGGAMGSG